MDHLQRQQCHKNINNNEDQNILWNEKCGKVFSQTALNEFEKLLLWLDGAADNLYLDTRDDVGDGGSEPQHYKYRVSEQRNSQLTEENANFSFMNTSHENAAFDSSFDRQFNVLQRGNPLDGLPLYCLTNGELCASEANYGGIVNYSNTSGISEPVYQSLSVVSEKDYIKLSIRDNIETFTSTLYEQNEMQNFNTFNAVSSEVCIATPDVSKLDAIFNNDTCITEKFEDIFKQSFLCFSNIPVSEDYSGNSGFTHDKKYEESYEERQNQTSSSVNYLDCVSRGNEFTNNYEPSPSVNDVNHVTGPSGMSAEDQRHPREKSFICPLCGKSFHRKDYLVVHYRNHTGEKPYACYKCGKGFVTKGHLTKHLVSHNEEKPFACDICDKKFARKGDVARHLNSHTGEKKYKCSVCIKAFADISNRKRHYKKIHNRKLTLHENLIRHF
ncbi:Zinc finger and BTB domain-containing protein 49 [Araneus ventricosus]|uniref:Zinc finger and BTB domain-containing protein 49 n=1 Tax=Araneus ventricosus TaxID=182803 RepID=A0A4Y2UUR1_ARAVE|nr:Zinc finger and BTB domain-containing protein 49 [Araneus ventricosus]